MKIFLITAITYLIASSAAVHAGSNACAQPDVIGVQVLGSGGPIADDGRASSGNLIWSDGKSIMLIDTGGGVFLSLWGGQGKDRRPRSNRTHPFSYRSLGGSASAHEKRLLH
jgi:Metal-dependent hydrolases of the beta-lactamase superfamily III